MELITNNPYRIIGIFANSSEKDILKQKSRIKRFSEVGKEITSEYDFPFFSSLQRNDNHIIDKAFSDIEQNRDKVTHSLFWFINLNPIDNTAIQYLISGNKEKAFEIWGKLTDEKNVNLKNFSAFNNVGTLYLLEESKSKQKQGITAKIKLIESGNFKDFICTVADETFMIEANKQIEILIDKLLMQFKDKYSIAETIDLFSNCSETTQKYLSKKFTEEPIHKIETQIEQAKTKRIKDKVNASRFGTDLHESTKNELTQLKSILGATNLQYKILADKVANEILQCSIDYFNDNKNNNSSTDYAETAMKLAKQAETIAVGSITKGRIKDSINTLEEMKDRELSEAITLLQSIKDAYETNEREIRAEVRRIKETDIGIRRGDKSIDEIAVMMSIINSINWGKVSDLLVTPLSDSNLKKIKESENNKLKNDFWKLASWIEMFLKMAIAPSIIDRYKSIPPKLPFKIVSSTITNTDNNPLYTKFVRYIELHLNVMVFESKSVEFFLKYITPSGNIKHNSETSPEGYTSSTVASINANTKVIDLPSWGNSDKCTYEVGKHRIEVFVDEYMIHSIDFVIDLAPSEKLEIELKKEENKLTEIKNAQLYKSELEIANAEMSEIQRFHLFRSSSTKQTQISEQQRKITNIQQKATDEKKKQIEQQNQIIYKIKSDLQIAKY